MRLTPPSRYAAGMMLRRASWGLVLVLGSACSGTTVGIADGSGGGGGADAAARDAVVVMDAATPPDSGAALDATTLVDAGEPVDATTAADAGQPIDTGEPVDAAELVDATPAADAGEPLDATAPVDTGTALDAGPPCPFTLDSTITATLRVSADDDRRVFVNEVMVDDLMPARTWPTISTRTVTLFRHPSRANVIAAEARNYFVISGYDRGLLLDVTALSGAPLVTDARWRVSTSSSAGYQTIAFDDSAWASATAQVQHPGGPYGSLFGSTAAWWIWLYDSNVAAGAKPVTEEMWARRTFYVQADGTFGDAPGACP